jgi:SAM-dependent methyltransferase
MDGLWRKESVYHRFGKRLRLLAHKYPERVQCNVCGWKGRRLVGNEWHPRTICPQCNSLVRHRLLFETLSRKPTLGVKNLVKGKRVLHIAPESIISTLLATDAAKYIRADLLRDDVDLVLDICNMKEVADRSFDLVVACDVLEHVPDDSAALREMNRVLAEGGWIIVTVPQKDKLPTTYEDGSVRTPEGRKAAFGQEDHLRIYGDDFPRRLEAHGFEVAVIDAKSFDQATVQRHVLFPPILSKHPLATNHRKLFFGQKIKTAA